MEFSMKLIVTLVLLGSALLFAGTASARVPSKHGPVVSGSITVPPEWAGVWQYTDTTYDCNGAFKSTSSGFDTLCAGATFDTSSTVSCTGSATSTTYSQHCTASGEVAPDCNYNFDIVSHGTRTNDTFFGVSVFNVTYSGTGEVCAFLTNSCTQTNTHETRIGPAPTEYCSTPAAPTTWGKLKASYR
jgi:hypothetical protein